MHRHLQSAFDGPTLLPTLSRGFAVRKARNVAILEPAGRLERGEGVELLRDQIGELLEAGTHNVAIDLAQVPYVDSSGIGALLLAYHSVRKAGGKCKFFGPQPQVMHIFKRVNLDKAFEFFEDEASALSSFQS